MKRWLFNLAAFVSLLLSLAAAAAWAMSYTPTPAWHLLGMAHSADLTRAHLHERTRVVMLPVDGSRPAPFGYWDALWARSQGGRLTLVAHRIDYDGHLRAVNASPPTLSVELSGPARAGAAAFDRMPDAGPPARQLGFAWEVDAQQAVDDGDGGGTVSVGARLITLPYWFIVLLGMPVPLLWLRRAAARRR